MSESWPWQDNPVVIVVSCMCSEPDRMYERRCEETAALVEPLIAGRKPSRSVAGASRRSGQKTLSGGTRSAAAGALPLIIESSRARSSIIYPGCATRYCIMYGQFKPTREVAIWQYAATLSLRDVKADMRELVSATALRLMSVFAACDSCLHGRIDAALACESDGGHYLSMIGGSGVVSWERALNAHQWRSCDKPADRVPGVFWGNYFGPTIAHRLECSALPLSGILDVDPIDGTEPTVSKDRRGGVMVTLSQDLLDTCNALIGPPDWAVARGVWLRQRLVEARVL